MTIIIESIRYPENPELTAAPHSAQAGIQFVPHPSGGFMNCARQMSSSARLYLSPACAFRISSYTDFAFSIRSNIGT